MLKTLPAYVWKEVRDHLAILIGLLVAVPLLLGICKLAIPKAIVENAVFAPITALSCYLIALLSFGSDLIPGEERRNRLDFLRRLPAGLTAPFLAKVFFLGATLAGFTAYGWTLGGLFGALPAQPHPQLASISVWAFCSAPWVFAVSTWLPRGALAVPAAGLALALFGLPFYMILNRPYPPPITPDEVTSFAYMLAGWSLVVAWYSWACGRRLSRDLGSAAWRGALASLVLFVPAWAYTGHRAREWVRLDFEAEFLIDEAYLSDNERLLYCNVRAIWDGPPHAAVLDLQTKEWRTLGEVGDVVRIPPPIRHSQRPPTRMQRAKLVSLARQGFGPYWSRFLDANTGQLIKAGWSDMELEEVAAAWGDEWHSLPKNRAAVFRRGHGWQVSGERESAVYDPYRKRIFPVNCLVLVRRGRWLVRDLVERRWQWQLVDPETGAVEPVRGLPQPMNGFELLADGRVLVSERRTGEASIVDPESGEAVPLGKLGPYVSIACEDPLLVNYVDRYRTRLGSIDPETGTVRDIGLEHGASLRGIAVLRDGDVLLLQNGCIKRCGHRREEIVWSR